MNTDKGIGARVIITAGVTAFSSGSILNWCP
jgi:hypothetical protein